MKGTDEKGRVLEHRPKQYVAGVVYNGVPLNITTNAGTYITVRGVFIPYKTSDGACRMRFNIDGTQSSSANFSVYIAGVVFKAGFKQSFLIHDFTNRYPPTGCYTVGGNNELEIHMSGAITDSHLSGDVELDSWPTWADPE